MKQEFEKTNKIIIHCSATTQDMDIGFKEIDRWHKDRGWYSPESDISCGYHIIVRRDGSAERGRNLDDVGAHVYGHQYRYPEDNRTKKQKQTLEKIIKIMVDLIGNPELEILGHRDLSPDVNGDGIIEPWEWMKDCPCFDAKEEYKHLKL